jgi:hypothetical protein
MSQRNASVTFLDPQRRIKRIRETSAESLARLAETSCRSLEAILMEAYRNPQFQAELRNLPSAVRDAHYHLWVSVGKLWGFPK